MTEIIKKPETTFPSDKFSFFKLPKQFPNDGLIWAAMHKCRERISGIAISNEADMYWYPKLLRNSHLDKWQLMVGTVNQNKIEEGGLVVARAVDLKLAHRRMCGICTLYYEQSGLLARANLLLEARQKEGLVDFIDCSMSANHLCVPTPEAYGMQCAHDASISSIRSSFEMWLAMKDTMDNSGEEFDFGSRYGTVKLRQIDDGRKIKEIMMFPEFPVVADPERIFALVRREIKRVAGDGIFE